MQVKSFGFSDIGSKRKKNEDVFLIREDLHFFSIADGMGGHQGGEIAAQEATSDLLRFMAQFYTHCKNDLTEEQASLYLKSAMESANARVFHFGKEQAHLLGMGTTLCCLALHRTFAVYGHVGDSRLYLLRNQQLIQMTQDHSHMQSAKHILTKAVGTSLKVDPTISSIPIYMGDLFFLCTDGLSHFVEKEEIHYSLTSLPAKEALSVLIETAKKKGSHDNITVLAIQVHALDEKTNDLS